MAETTAGIKAYEWYAEECKRVNGDIIPTPVASKRFLVLKQAVGVCGFITPVNLLFKFNLKKNVFFLYSYCYKFNLSGIFHFQ